MFLHNLLYHRELQLSLIPVLLLRNCASLPESDKTQILTLLKASSTKRTHRGLRMVFLHILPTGSVFRLLFSSQRPYTLTGFLHKPTFMHTLLTSPSSLSPFLLLSMLSISARFTPSLIQRYQTGPNAAQVFAKRAQKLAGEELLGAATLERAQGFFLCSIWSWGSGYRDRSWVRGVDFFNRIV